MSGRFPFPLPQGWFMVAFSHELAPGEVRPLKYFGKDLVLFRRGDGTPALLDAWCPHLGAHLGVGGRVDGSTLVCPFHGWAFDGGGSCVRIPYGGADGKGAGVRIPRQARVNAWEVREHSGMILAWHDLQRRAPHWEPPVAPEHGHDDWTPYHTRRWTIATCNQEMAENAVDSAHFYWLHGTVEQPPTSAEILAPHVLHMRSATLMSTGAGPVTGGIEAHMFGFGYTMTRFTGLVETLLVSSATPIDEGRCDMAFAFTVRRTVPPDSPLAMGGDGTLQADITKGIGKAFVKEIARQLEQDIPIWENKRYLPRPVLCEADGPVGLFRTWSRQFYPAESEVTSPPF